MKFRSQHVIYKPLSFFLSSIPFAQLLKTTSSSHLLLTLKLTWGWDGPARLRTGFPLRMFSIRLLSSSAFVLIPSWPALLFFLFKFFPGLQDELQCHHHHSPLQNLHLPRLLEGGLHQAWPQESGPVELLRHWRGGCIFSGWLISIFTLQQQLSVFQLSPEITDPHIFRGILSGLSIFSLCMRG